MIRSGGRYCVSRCRSLPDSLGVTNSFGVTGLAGWDRLAALLHGPAGDVRRSPLSHQVVSGNAGRLGRLSPQAHLIEPCKRVVFADFGCLWRDLEDAFAHAREGQLVAIVV